MGDMSDGENYLLGVADVRALAEGLGVRPTKTLGQNFVHDAGTVRKIVREAGVQAGDYVLEVGPGLGSLTLALLEAGAYVSAVEIDERLAEALPQTVAERAPEKATNFAVTCRDALTIAGVEDLAPPTVLEGQSAEPRFLVANLPYNVAVPVLLTLLEAVPSLERGLVMVQSEVAERLAAQPGSRTYGVPSVKVAWYATAKLGSKISRSVFWPVPNVDSSLLAFECRPDSEREAFSARAPREAVFEVIDAAFAQRRKTLRAALGQWAGSPARAEEILRAASVEPSVRGEKLALEDFIAIAAASKNVIARKARSA